MPSQWTLIADENQVTTAVMVAPGTTDLHVTRKSSVMHTSSDTLMKIKLATGIIIVANSPVPMSIAIPPSASLDTGVLSSLFDYFLIQRLSAISNMPNMSAQSFQIT